MKTTKTALSEKIRSFISRVDWVTGGTREENIAQAPGAIEGLEAIAQEIAAMLANAGKRILDDRDLVRDANSIPYRLAAYCFRYLGGPLPEQNETTYRFRELTEADRIAPLEMFGRTLPFEIRYMMTKPGGEQVPVVVEHDSETGAAGKVVEMPKPKRPKLAKGTHWVKTLEGQVIDGYRVIWATGPGSVKRAIATAKTTGSRQVTFKDEGRGDCRGQVHAAALVERVKEPSEASTWETVSRAGYLSLSIGNLKRAIEAMEAYEALQGRTATDTTALSFTCLELVKDPGGACPNDVQVTSSSFLDAVAKMRIGFIR